MLPGSKSLTNRALILAALARAPVVLRGALWSEDTQAMVECLERLGFGVEVADDPAEPANRTLTVQGAGGRIPNAGTPDKPLELFVENAGTAARFLPPMLCLGHGSYRVSGIERMHQRPQAALVAALRQLGYRIDTPNDRLPAVIHGTGPRPGAACSVSVEESSQFASALLLSAGIGGWQVSRHRRQRGRAALRRHDAPPGEGLPLERRHLRHRGRCLGRQLLLGRRLAAARERQPRHGRADAQQRHAGRPEVPGPGRPGPVASGLFAPDRPCRQHHDGDRAGALRAQRPRASPSSAGCACRSASG